MKALGSILLSGIAWLLSAALTVYASSKLFGYQFVLLESVGDYPLRDVSPMDLMWAFFGYSQRYGFCLGVFELVCCALLLYRRTRTLGAILAASILANIVFLDIEYEVYGPLGIAIVQLLLALILVAAGWRSIAAAVGALLSISQKTRPLLAAAATIAWLVWLVFLCGKVVERRASHHHELRGGWTVNAFRVGGADVPLTGGDKVRDPVLYFEFAGATVLALDGKEIQGMITFRNDHTRLRWIMDLGRWRAEEDPSLVFEADITRNGDQLVLAGKRNGEDVRMELQRRPRWRPIDLR